MSKSRRYDQKPTASAAITPIEYSGLQAAYDHFNDHRSTWCVPSAHPMLIDRTNKQLKQQESGPCP